MKEITPLTIRVFLSYIGDPSMLAFTFSREDIERIKKHLLKCQDDKARFL